MSCSTTSLSACTIKNSLAIEDPYVFTETAPTTPPSLFNNSQKSRSRLVVKHINKSPAAKASKLPTTNKDTAYAKVKYNATKTQTASIANAKSATLSSAGVLGVLNTNNIKYVSQALKQQLDSNQTKYAQQNENAAANIQTAAVRNSQQQKPQQKTQQQQQQSQTPPPYLLSHTPSLWQTPLLLDSPSTMEASSSSSSSSALPVVPLTTSATSLATTQAAATVIKNVNVAAPAAFVSPLNRQSIKISFQHQTPTATLITPITIPATTTATGTIAPIQLLIPSAAPLPPSNFHNTTLAQHLQKVQCLKKSKKPNSSSAIIASAANQKLGASTNKTTKNATKNATKNKTQHSTNDLNDIPVNVIFRSPTKPKSFDSSSYSLNQTRNAIDEKTKSFQALSNNFKSLPATENSIQTNFNKKSSTGVAIVSNQPIKLSSKASQKRRIYASALDGQQFPKPKQRKLQRPSAKSAMKVVTQQHPNELLSIAPNNISPKTTSAKKRKQSNVLQKPQKRNQKFSFPTKTFTEQDQHDFAIAIEHFSSTTTTTTSTTKAVAVLRMPPKEFEEDTSQLADDSVLPYCLQFHWWNPNEKLIRSSEIGREQRINEYKSLLRRQAMQLWATRSLQKVPFHIARKRLICVDDLLKKYRDHNKTVIGNITKICEVESCPHLVMEMSTYCHQHIMKNTKQSLFVQCSAKNLRDIQKPCEIPVLNIQKPYSVPLCYLHAAKHRNDASAASDTTNSFSPSIQTKSKQKHIAAKTTACRRRKAATANINQPMPSEPKDAINNNLLSSTSGMENTIAAGLHENCFETNMLSPPTTFVPLTYNNSNNNKNDNDINSVRNSQISGNNLIDDFTDSSHHRTDSSNIFGRGTIDPTAEQEINKLVAQFAMAAAATATNNSNSTKNNNYNSSSTNNNNNNNNNSFNYMNTNSNSNLTSSGVGSSSSLPSTDELLTHDMLSICENSSAYASSEDTGLGELSENELIGASVGGGGIGLNDDDVSPDEIPLGDTRGLLEETDLVNVFGALPVNINELFNAVVRQDERDEVERALEMADKHLKTLQETIGSDSDFLADFLDVNDEMLAETNDIVNKMEIVSSVLSPPESLEATSLYLENTDSGLNMNHHGATNSAVTGNCVSGNVNNTAIMDIRGLLQT